MVLVTYNVNVCNFVFQKVAKDRLLEVESRMGAQSQVLKRKNVPVTPVHSAHKLRKMTGSERTAISENNPWPKQQPVVCSSSCLLNFWTSLLLLLSSYVLFRFFCICTMIDIKMNVKTWDSSQISMSLILGLWKKSSVIFLTFQVHGWQEICSK
jgi:hypothetical protein